MTHFDKGASWIQELTFIAVQYNALSNLRSLSVQDSYCSGPVDRMPRTYLVRPVANSSDYIEEGLAHLTCAQKKQNGDVRMNFLKQREL